MPRAPPAPLPALLLLLLAAATAARAADVFVIADTANQTLAIADAVNDTVARAADLLRADNDTLSDDEHEPVVRKKRTFGDLVFRGLADVLGYNVARKPPQAYEFPPPVAPVPGIDAPLQAGPAPAPAPAPAAPPCGAPRAAAPPPCRAPQPPAQPRAQPPCPRPRAAPPKPKPTRPPAPAPPPPCGAPRANPTTAAPCAPAPPPKADSNLETINTNFRLNLNFNRAVATPATAADDAALDAEEPAQQPVAPVAIQPRAARLPPAEPRNPRVYVDAYVLRDGVAQRVHTVDAQNINRPPVAADDYLFYDDEEPQPQDQQDFDDDYEDVPEGRGRSADLREVGAAVDQFWAQKQKPKQKKKSPTPDYRKVHFGDRDLANQIIRRSDDNFQNIESDRKKPKRIPSARLPDSDGEEESEVTTTTQDPRRKLKPRVLPPTEHNPNQIDTVTVRVPPIYKEKRPKKLHRETPEAPDRDEEDARDAPRDDYLEEPADADGDQSAHVERTEPPKRRRRRKKNRRTRSTRARPYSAGDYDYYGNKMPVSEEEEFYRGLTVPPPTRDADVARLEDADDHGHFLDDHERLREDPERIRDKPHKKGSPDAEKIQQEERADEAERADDSERSDEESERSDEERERADEREKSDRLSANARVHETGYSNNYVRAHNVQVDDPRPRTHVVHAARTALRPRAR